MTINKSGQEYVCLPHSDVVMTQKFDTKTSQDIRVRDRDRDKIFKFCSQDKIQKFLGQDKTSHLNFQDKVRQAHKLNQLFFGPLVL